MDKIRCGPISRIAKPWDGLDGLKGLIMGETKPEITCLTNRFGTVTDRRIVYFRKKGWFSKGTREDIPLRHVTSILAGTHRPIVAGVVLLIVGSCGAICILPIPLIPLAIFMLWGSPMVVINTTGGDVNAGLGFPWHRAQAEAFAEAARSQLFREE